MRSTFILCFLIPFLGLNAQKLFKEMSPTDQKLYKEHVILGQPDGDKSAVFVRQGYVLKYNEKYRIPVWVAYHIIPDYLNTPKREKKYKQFRTDPDIKNPVLDKYYTGTGYARGHMAPYFAMGGDRDNDGKYSDLFDRESDPYDDLTVFQANYLSNIAPQDQDALNGPGGPWYALETAIREDFVGKAKMELNVIVGSIIDDSTNYKTMKGTYGNFGIAVPDQFFQVLVYKTKDKGYITAGFLFPHVSKKSDLPSDNLMDYIVPVDTIENLTGLDFLNKLSRAKQKKTESLNNKEFWENIKN